MEWPQLTDGLAAFPDPLSCSENSGAQEELSSPQAPESPRMGRGETQGSNDTKNNNSDGMSRLLPGVYMSTLKCLTHIILLTTLKETIRSSFYRMVN